MELYKFEMPKEKLVSVPKKELLFFIQLTNLANEIFILQKQMFFSAPIEEEVEIIRRARNSQSLFFVRLTAGKLWEGWQLLVTHFFNTQLSNDYFPLLRNEGKVNLDRLKKYFSKDNLIKYVRNKYAFHYSKESSEKILQVISTAHDTEVFSLYFSEQHGNCFYEMSDTLLNISLLRTINENDNQKSMQVLLFEVKDIVRYFLRFFGECVLVFGKRCIGFEYTVVEIPEPPEIDHVVLPYFVSRPNPPKSA